MPRRRNRQTSGPTAEQALAASVAANRELRAELDAAEKKLVAERAQLEFHKGVLVAVRTELAEKGERTRQLEQRVESLTRDLARERAHTAGSCSHYADLKAMGVQVTALERRVDELQQANMARDVAVLPGWESVAAIPAAPQRRALGRGRG